MANHWTLSEEEARSSRPWLSVFDIGFSTWEQALAIAGGNRDAYVEVPVSEIHRIRKCDSSGRLLRMHVRWDCINSQQPGAIGHAAIEGTLRREGEEKKAYAYLRQRLAYIANDPSISRIVKIDRPVSPSPSTSTDATINWS